MTTTDTPTPAAANASAATTAAPAVPPSTGPRAAGTAAHGGLWTAGAPVLAFAVCTVGVLAGAGLAVVGGAGGAAAMVLAVGLVVALVAVFVRPVWACALVFAGAAIGNRELPGAPLGLQFVHGIVVLAIGAVLLAIIAGAPADRIRRPEVRLPLLFATTLVIGAMLSTASASVASEKSLKVTATMLAGLLIAAAVIVVGRTGNQLRLLLAAASLGSLLVTFPAILAGPQFEAVYQASVVRNRPTSEFADPNELGSYSAIALFLALGWLIAARRRWEKAIAAAAAVCAVVALTLSLSRGAWLGAVVGMIVLVTLHPRTRRVAGWLTLGLASLVLAALLVAPASGPVGVIVARVASIGAPSESPYDARPIIWQEAVREFNQKPLLGNGPGTFSLLSARAPSVIQFYPIQHAHNGVLTVAAEMGSVGVIAFVGLVVTMILAVRGRARRLRATHRWEDLGVLAGGAAALGTLSGHLLVDYPLRNPVLMVTVWAIIGLVLAAVSTPAAPARGSRRRPAEIYAASPQ